MVFYPVRDSPVGVRLHLRRIFGYRGTVLPWKDGRQVIREF